MSDFKIETYSPQKYIVNKKETKKYTYYRCTKKRKDYKCTQSKHIRLEDLETQINSEIEQLTILPEFKEWALDILREQNQLEVDTKIQVQKSLHQTIKSTESQLDKLTDLLLRELINEEEFKKKKESLQTDLLKLKNQRDQTEERSQNWRDLTEQTFNFVTYSQYH